MAITRTQLENKMRAELLEQLMEKYAGEDVGVINSHAVNIPVVYEDGTEGWANITISLIRDPEHDGYQEREDYVMKCEEKEAKAKAKAEAKAKKNCVIGASCAAQEYTDMAARQVLTSSGPTSLWRVKF